MTSACEKYRKNNGELPFYNLYKKKEEQSFLKQVFFSKKKQNTQHTHTHKQYFYTNNDIVCVKLNVYIIII